MLIGIILVGLITLALWKILRKPSDYPPGPWGLPFIGYVPLSFPSFQSKMEELHKQNGKIFSWRMGTKLMVFLCDFKIIKEAFNSPAFANRPPMQFLSFLVDQFDIGVFSTNGIHWRKIRRFTIQHLRDLGMGKSKLVSAVQFEALEFVKELKKEAGKPSPMSRTLKPAIINVLWQLLTGTRYDLNDKTILEIDNIVHQIEENLSWVMISDLFPWTKLLFSKLLMRNFHLKLSNKISHTFEAAIEEHAATLDKNKPRDFIDAYLIEMEKQKFNPECTMSKDDLKGCINDLFGAGFETTATIIYWIILYLAKFPEVQRKLQKEIDTVLPNGIQATMDDKSRCPMTEAYITEVLRFSSLASFGIPRTVLEDITFNGYTIPKGAIILSSVESIHFDPSYYELPKEFRPERFLNSEGKFELPKTAFLPFGIGKRVCLGESMARMKLFIFLTTMVQHLHFSAPPNKEVDIRPVDVPLFNQPRVDQDVLITLREQT